MRFPFVYLVGLTLVCCAARADDRSYENPPIEYSRSAPTDPVVNLKRVLDEGKTSLESSPTLGYLEPLLKALKISPSSQALVYSKTSFQSRVISPRNPRAVYFNDDVYVGYIPHGDVIEIASTDPKLGTIFYTVSQHAAVAKIERQTESCLGCHGDSFTRGVPGLMIRSVFTGENGRPLLPAGAMITTHKTPLKERWGGWYVTGSDGGQPHMGNTFWHEREGVRDPQLLRSFKTNSNGLGERIDTSAYPTPYSDIVALMVLEHQADAHNQITRAAYGTLRALRDEKILSDALGEKRPAGEHSESTIGRIRSSCEPLVACLLFSEEAPLAAPISGSSDFAKDFSERGPRDEKGRSLRDFDLTRRLFKYPCSFLIYSDGIAHLPDEAKSQVYRRLDEILSGKDQSAAFANLSPAERSAIREILDQTLPAIHQAWQR